MAKLTPAARTHLIRVASIIVTALISQPALAAFIHSTAVRYPLVGAVIGAVGSLCFVLTEPVDVVVPGSRKTPPQTSLTPPV